MLQIIEQMSNLDIREGTSNDDLEFIHNILSSIATNNMLCIEIGSWKGASTAIIADILKKYNNSYLYCIDHWEGNLNTWQKDVVKGNNIYDLFIHNMDLLNLLDVIKIIKSDSETAIKNFENNSIDFIFIDGDHTYNVFKNDTMLYWDKLKVGGIICGHDCEAKYTDLPHLKDFLENNKNSDFTNFSGGDNSYHCGVIKALYDFFNDEYQVHKNSTIWSKVKE